MKTNSKKLAAVLLSVFMAVIGFSLNVSAAPELTFSASLKPGPFDSLYGRPWPGLEIFGSVSELAGTSAVVSISDAYTGAVVYDDIIPLVGRLFGNQFISFKSIRPGIYNVDVAVIDDNYETVAYGTKTITHTAPFLEGEHIVTTNIHAGTVKTITETYPNGWPIEITDGDTIRVDGVSYKIATAKIGNFTVPDGVTGVYHINSPTTVEIYCFNQFEPIRP